MLNRIDIQSDKVSQYDGFKMVFSKHQFLSILNYNEYLSMYYEYHNKHSELMKAIGMV